MPRLNTAPMLTTTLLSRRTAARCGCSAPLVLLLALLAAAALWTALPARASAATVESGALSQLGEPSNCIGEAKVGFAKCGTSVPNGLSFAYQVEVSPDGRNAYSVAVNGDLIEYARNRATGALGVIGCFSSLAKTEPACEEHAEMEVSAIASPAAIAISPNGASLYAITQETNDLVEFSRDPATGELTKSGCITHEASSSECATTGAKGLDLPYGIAVSPDGENVYVAGYGEEAVAEFKRNTDTGALTQLEGANDCISADKASGCGTTTGVIGLKEAIGVAISPDGKDVYIAAGARSPEGDIAAFERGAEGALEQLPGAAACISESVAVCAKGEHIQGSEDLLVSPDGKNVYANSYAASAVVELQRNASGALEQLTAPNECVSSGPLTGCREAKAIGGALGVAVSPDGEDLYVSSGSENAVAAFKRGAGGGLEQFAADPCVTEEASGCEPPGSDALVGLKYARRLTVSPDGTNVYVAGQEAHAIVELARTVTPKISRINLTYGSLTGGMEVYVKGSGFAEGAKVSFGGTPASEVTVTSASTLIAKSPPFGAEQAVAVEVENGAGASTASPADQFTYTDRPTVAGVTPSIGAETGDTTVTITGSGLLEATKVYFGSALASSFTVNSAESITATSPPGSGVVDVRVETPHGLSESGAGDRFTYVHGSPAPVSGLFLAGYCEELGDPSVTLEKEENFSGPGFAYENWACVEPDGTEVLIANTGPAPSMDNACESENSGVKAYAYPTESGSAYSWGCYEVTPPKEAEKGEEGNTTANNLLPITKLPSEVVVASTTVPAPVLARTGNVSPVSGTVLVRLPASKTFVPLSALRQIPFGTVVEATHGRVSVTTAGPHGGTQTGEFFAGEFVLKQGANGLVVAELTGGNFSVCPTARERSHSARASAAHASPKHVVRKLWANAHGSFSTKGNYAAGAVQGTEWLTEDLCEGTLIRVTRDKVAVTNLVNHRHVEVRTGHHYLAKAP
jgi:DNA-binding beta-propeller fold protein YncE